MNEILTPGRNAWRVEEADNVAVIIDAEDYFHAARDAMMRARHSIMMVGWDFDARIRFDSPGHSDDGPDRLGDFVLWLVDRTPGLEIRLLQWNSGMMKNWFRGTNAWYLARWKMHKRITARMDGMHPPAGSHHQKLLIVDDSLAFCGGIDMTVKRWDTRAHADDEPGRVSPSGRKLEPWHDCAALVDGPAAKALAEVGRRRWQRATGETLEAATTPALDWPDRVRPLARHARVAVSRSRPEMTDQTPVREIEALYLDLIAQAKRVIYAESQYFASRRIAVALSRRLEEPDGPEVVILNPHTADGWLEPLAMDTARARLIQSLRQHDPHGRLAVYHPVTAAEKPIYVHAKLMIVDDRFLRIGSSNFNNRSMRLDSECDVALDAAQDASGDMRRALMALRDDLLAEHLGCDAARVTAEIARHGSVIAAIEALRGPGRSLVPYEVPDLNAVEEWLADNEILDPDGPEEMFEAPGKRGLFRGRLRSPAGD
ncbi:phospholipase D-like domain-containing protein [Falsirhodobacter halotolerans]|uniref:phospholipase D-like domain-containing protein n=1 Tax=Falsirhodobacter halotolerans TaxID=1146892 RepID=UPI001FD01BD4|nr:phospholipase D-like domain-containing protein [Falsirhodobacter halotolerans]MCJ8140776.1 phospholipase D-like domain-containing protein [Falsirhodobacter halotolerans]